MTRDQIRKLRNALDLLLTAADSVDGAIERAPREFTDAMDYPSARKLRHLAESADYAREVLRETRSCPTVKHEARTCYVLPVRMKREVTK